MRREGSETAIESVRRWLGDHGYPLEMKVASVLEQAGFQVVQGEYYQDPDTKTYRETDVVAFATKSEGGVQAIVAIVVECKTAAKGKPWVLFTRGARLPSALVLERLATSKRGQRALFSIAHGSSPPDLSCLRVPERTGYAMREAHNRDQNRDNNRDRAYEAMVSVAKAARGIVDGIPTTDRPDSTIIPVALPFIVLDAVLVEAYAASDGQVLLEEIQEGLLASRNPIITRQSLVRVLTKSAFADAASNLKSEVDAFVSAILDSAHRLSRQQ